MLPQRPSTAEAQPADTGSLQLALGGTFALRLAANAAGFIIPVYLGLRSRQGQADAGPFLVSAVAVAFYASELVGSPVFGSLSDRLGRRAFLLLGPVLGAVAVLVFGFSAVIPVIILTRVLQGLSTAASVPATLSYISAETASSPRLRGRFMGLFEAATVVGLAGGTALGGDLYQRLGQGAFPVVAVVYALAFALFLGVRTGPRQAPVAASPLGIARRLLNVRILRFAPAWLAANMVVGAWFALGPYLAAGHPDSAQLLMGGFSPRRIGLAFLVFGVVFTVGSIAWGYLMPTIGRRATLLFGVGGLGFSTIMLWVLNQASPHRPHVLEGTLVGLVILGVLLESGFTPAALAYLAEIAEEQAQDRGAVMGIYSVLLSVGQLLGGLVGAPFASRWGVNGLIVLSGLLCVVATMTVLSLHIVEGGPGGRTSASPAPAR